MAGGVVLTFDPALDAAVRESQRLVAEVCGAPVAGQDLLPHITLLIAEDLDPANWETGLARMAAVYPPIPLRFGAVASFFGPEGVVYLAPGVSSALVTLQSQAIELARQLGATPWAHMQAGEWTPHCTLGVGLSDQQLSQAISAVCTRGVGIAGRAVALVPFTLDGDRAVTGQALPLGG